MCKFCKGPPADRATLGNCDHCFRWGKVWFFEIPLRLTGLSWHRERWCGACISRILLTAA